MRLYRKGQGRRGDLIPRPSDENGLSFFDNLATLARETGARAGVDEWFSIESGGLVDLKAVQDERPGKEDHYLVVPVDGAKMIEWIGTRSEPLVTHQFTTELRAALDDKGKFE